MLLPGTPIPGETKKGTISSPATNVVVTLDVSSPQYVVTNSESGSMVFVRVAETSGAAVAVVDEDYGVLPGTSQTFSKPNDFKSFGLITASGTTTAWITPIDGE